MTLNARVTQWPTCSTANHRVDPSVQIAGTEKDIVQLKEDLIQERTDARVEKNNLKKAVVSVSVKFFSFSPICLFLS